MDNFFSEGFVEVLSDIYYLLLLGPILIVVLRRRQFVKEQRLIAVIVVVTAINDYVTFVLSQQKVNNLWVYHIFVPLLFVVILKIYRSQLAKLFSDNFFRVLLIAFVVFALTNSIFFQPIDSFNSNVIVLAGLIYIFLCLSYFYLLLKEPKGERLENNPMIWLNTGLLLYQSGTLVLFLFVNNVIAQSNDIVLASWGLNTLFGILLVLFYCAALWVNPQK